MMLLPIALAWTDLQSTATTTAERRWDQLLALSGGAEDPSAPAVALAERLRGLSPEGIRLLERVLTQGEYPGTTEENRIFWKTVGSLSPTYIPMPWGEAALCRGDDREFGRYDDRQRITAAVRDSLAELQGGRGFVLVMGFSSPAEHDLLSPNRRESELAWAERRFNLDLAHRRTDLVIEALSEDGVPKHRLLRMAAADDSAFYPDPQVVPFNRPPHLVACTRFQGKDPADRGRQGVVVMTVPGEFFDAVAIADGSTTTRLPTPVYPELPEVDIPSGPVEVSAREDGDPRSLFDQVCVPMSEQGRYLGRPGFDSAGNIVAGRLDRVLFPNEVWSLTDSPQARTEVVTDLVPQRSPAWRGGLVRELLHRTTSSSGTGWRVPLVLLRETIPDSTLRIPLRTVEGDRLVSLALDSLQGLATQANDVVWGTGYPMVVAETVQFSVGIDPEAVVRPRVPSLLSTASFVRAVELEMRTLSLVELRPLVAGWVNGERYLVSRAGPLLDDHDRGFEERAWVNALYRTGAFDTYPDALAEAYNTGKLRSARMRCELELAGMGPK